MYNLNSILICGESILKFELLFFFEHVLFCHLNKGIPTWRPSTMYQYILPQFIETYYKDWRSLEVYTQSGISY